MNIKAIREQVKQPSWSNSAIKEQRKKEITEQIINEFAKFLGRPIK